MNYEVVGAKFVASADSPEKLKLPLLREVAFIGRSNVGKSSLLNALTNQKSLARVSKAPGRTRAFNFFEIEYRQSGTKDRERTYFVDLPGYGYAAVSKSLQALWGRTIGDYIQGRKRLSTLLLLVDVRREIDDKEIWVRENAEERQIAVVVTKADKLSRGKAESRRREIAKELAVPLKQVFLTSTLKGNKQGVQELLNYIMHES